MSLVSLWAQAAVVGLCANLSVQDDVQYRKQKQEEPSVFNVMFAQAVVRGCKKKINKKRLFIKIQHQTLSKITVALTWLFLLSKLKGYLKLCDFQLQQC